MTTLKFLQQERTEARLHKNTLKYSLLTTLIGDIQLEQSRPQPMSVEAVIRKYIKNTEMILGICPDNDQAAQERLILQSYLPKQLTREQLTNILITLDFKALPMGEYMKYLKNNYPGQYDGKLAAEVYNT